ncbi:hypothetical protein ACWV95_14935 [Streptomyces albus]
MSDVRKSGRSSFGASSPLVGVGAAEVFFAESAPSILPSEGPSSLPHPASSTAEAAATAANEAARRGSCTAGSHYVRRLSWT